MKRHRHARRMLWVSPPSIPSSDTVASTEGWAAWMTGAMSGASSRPCAAPIAWDSPWVRSTAIPPSHSKLELLYESIGAAPGAGCALIISP